ncbi:MAG: hypothetical protein ACXWP0_00905 [Ktedonobacterales bacterium]
MTVIGSIITALIARKRHPVDISNSLMDEALDLVDSLRTERIELREELASLRAEIIKCRQEVASLREENAKLQLALTALGGTVDTVLAEEVQTAPEKITPESALSQAPAPRRRRTARHGHQR